MKLKGKILVLLFICNNYACNNPREKLFFNDKIENIQSALLEMNVLLYKLPKNSNNFNTNYGFANNKIEINSRIGIGVDSTHEITEQALKCLSVNDRLRFLKLAEYLKDNDMSEGYIDQQLNKCMFLYHTSTNTSFDDVREIIILKKPDVAALRKLYKILDRKDMIYLIAPIRQTND